MKKFLFSAVALTVFSFSALANNEVKEENTNPALNDSNTAFLVTDCGTVAYEAMEEIDPNHELSSAEYSRQFGIIKRACERNSTNVLTKID